MSDTNNVQESILNARKEAASLQEQIKANREATNDAKCKYRYKYKYSFLFVFIGWRVRETRAWSHVTQHTESTTKKSNPGRNE